MTPCLKCYGTGETDSGGVTPWGTGINIPCECTLKIVKVVLSDREHAVLSELAKKKGMSEENIMRQALRMYQTIDIRMERGEKPFNDPVFGCGGDDT